MSGLFSLADLSEEEYLELRMKEAGIPHEEVNQIKKIILSDIAVEALRTSTTARRYQDADQRLEF